MFRVPNAKPDIEIYGMLGIPSDVLADEALQGWIHIFQNVPKF